MFDCLLCLSNIYFEGAVGYVDVKKTDLQPYVVGFKGQRDPIYALTGVRLHDINVPANPMGRVAVGYEIDSERLTLSLEIRHESWIGTSRDHGQNSVWVSARLRPFR